MTSINNKELYQKRMCQSTDYKFDAVKDYLYKDCEFLDFGAGFNPEFIKKIENTGAIYTAYDESKYILNKLINKSINVDLSTDFASEKEYDVIFMSSVLHEILSFKSVPMVIHTLENIYQALKPSGHLIVRDWDYPYLDESKNIEAHYDFIKPEKIAEIKNCANTLYKNAITNKSIHIYGAESSWYSVDAISGVKEDLFELMFHVIWGKDSLARESEEKYNTHRAIEKYLLRRHNDLILVEAKAEFDESFLPHLQKYFNIEKLPYPTKLVNVYQKSLTH